MAVKIQPDNEVTARHESVLRRRIRKLLYLMMGGLLVSGLTAFPIESEIRLLVDILKIESGQVGIARWLVAVNNGVSATNRSYPFLAYGTDWLAFAHLMIAAIFIGPLRDPLRNRWVIDWGLLACAGVLPLALIAGPLRGIPLYWRMIDCSFGLVGAIPLWFCRRYITELEELQNIRSACERVPQQRGPE
jgi:hypothetical protein